MASLIHKMNVFWLLSENDWLAEKETQFCLLLRESQALAVDRYTSTLPHSYCFKKTSQEKSGVNRRDRVKIEKERGNRFESVCGE